MKIQSIIISLLVISLLVFVMGASGCTQETPNSTDKTSDTQINQSTPFENTTTIKNVTLPNLKITNLDCYTDIINWTHVKGNITNDGIITADYVIISVDLFNKDKLVDTIETTFEVPSISPEESYNFSGLKKGLPTWTRCEVYTKYSDEVAQATWRYDNKIEGETGQKVTVTRVIDGDTIEISTGERVRLIGINAPEEGEKCYEESKEFLEDFLSGKEITLKKDVEDKDRYGRLLRYVFAFDDKENHDFDVNYGMIYMGFAYAYEYGLNTKNSDWFNEAEEIAKENENCLWGDVGPSEYICSSNYYNCGDFSTYVEAKAVFDYCKSQGKGDIHFLDGDADGSPCESLP